jgi:hypothetical protein
MQTSDQRQRDAAREALAAIGEAGPLAECRECGGACWGSDAVSGVHAECRHTDVRPVVTLAMVLGAAMTLA